MLGPRKLFIAVGVLVAMIGSSPGAATLADDFETDFWLPFTDFLLGDQATAGYSSGFARSGTRSFHVDIHGYKLLDFGSAYGYAVYATRGSAVTELRVSLLNDRLEDLNPSPWDAYAAGVALDLLDKDYRSLDRVRYITAFQASRRLALCGPTKADVVLPPPAGLGQWTDIGRNPAVDFPTARWHAAKFVRISIGFLCTAGLKGAAYSMYFDDFMLDTAAGDADGDGLSNLDEEARVYAMSVASGSVPLVIFPSGTATIDVFAPPVVGIVEWAGVGLEIAHPRPDDLSVEVILPDDRTQLLWDPGFEARGAGILSPTDGGAVHGTIEVRGMAWRPNPFVHFYVDDVWVSDTQGSPDGRFVFPWSADEWTEGVHRLHVGVQAIDGGALVSRVSKAVSIVVDRTPPVVELLRPAAGDRVRGLAAVEAGAHDDRGIAAVVLQVDGISVETRTEEPFTFFYETAGLVPGPHTFGVRAVDRAGNEADRHVDVRVGLTLEDVPLPCFPVCNLKTTATSGNLPPLAADPTPIAVPLASGDQLEVREAFRAPWVPRVVRTDTGVSLLMDATRDRSIPESDGLVGSRLGATDFLNLARWRIVVRDHGVGAGGFVQAARILIAARSSTALADTDSDGLKDGLERSLFGTVPVLPDVDADLLRDGDEVTAREIPFVIDGALSKRTIRTNPLDFDTDRDGLADGLELTTGEGRNPSDPTDSDTDRDGLVDGLERSAYGSDPTRTDTDADTLSDLLEVTPRSLELEIDGATEVRSIVTSPTSDDTDNDGLRDNQEWDGHSLYGFRTDPADPDTDRDGLSDLDELIGLNRRPTNPVGSDTDGDGLGDGLDLSPTELWNLPWRGTFEAGMIRFTQRFNVLGVYGSLAGIWTYNIVDDSCAFLSDHTATATRSSDGSEANVLATMNKVLVDGGEHNFTATSAEYVAQDTWGLASYVYGGCDLGSPRQYRIEYVHDSNSFDIDFMNSEPAAIRDDGGDLFYYATLGIPIRLSKPQSVVLQVLVSPDADRGGETVVPAMVYSLYRGTDFVTTPPFYRNLAVAAVLDEHAYEFHMRIPEGVASEDNVILADGVPTATLVVMPMWLNRDASGVTRLALNATRITVGAAISQVQEDAELVVARLATDMESLEAVLPSSAAGLVTNYYTFGAYSVYVYRLGDTFDSAAPEAVDAVYIVGESPEELASFQETIRWAPDGAWARKSEDGFGLAIGIFKIIRRGISLTSQLTAAMVIPLLNTPSGAMEQMNFGRSTFVVTKLTDFETGVPYYVLGETAVQTVKLRVAHPEIPGVFLTEVRTIERQMRGEIIDNLDDSRLLTGVKYAQLKSGLRGAAVGATLVIFGSQAVLAFRDGDSVKGTFYTAAGATAVFGIVKADVPLFERVFTRVRITKGISIKLGTAAAVAVGGLLASYEIYLASQSTNPIVQLSHYEGAGAIAVDTLVAAVPLYGTAAMLGWQLGLLAAVGLQAIVGTLPDPIALKVVSTPGSAVVFIFEYVFATEIPSDVANDALVQLLHFLADAARFLNSLDPPQPTLLLVP